MTALQSVRDGVFPTTQPFDPGKARAFAGLGKKCGPAGLIAAGQAICLKHARTLSDYGLFTMPLAVLAYKALWTAFKGRWAIRPK
ncbi:MAG: hypothetical protein WAZ34_14040 [Rhodocyclaceae bacterium]